MVLGAGMVCGADLKLIYATSLWLIGFVNGDNSDIGEQLHKLAILSWKPRIEGGS